MSIELPPYRPVTRRSGLTVMGAALHALFMRELQTRFGSFRLGYLWAPLEVFFQVVVLLVIFGVFIERAVPGMSYPIFLITALVPFRMFQNISNRSLSAVEANSGLLMYRAVRHIDVVIARAFLELVIYFFTSIILFIGLSFFGMYISFANLHILLMCWITFFIFCFGIALILMVVGFYGGEIKKVISIALTFLFFASGVLYPLSILPEPYFSFLLYNPFIHNLELMRHSVAPSYPSAHIDFGYFLEWMFILFFIGLLMYKATEKDMIRSR